MGCRADFAALDDYVLVWSVEAQLPGWAVYGPDVDGDMALRDEAAWCNLFTGEWAR